MSAEFSADKLEVRDEAGNLIVDHNTKLLPVTQKLELTNVDLAFPDVSKSTNSIMNSGQRGTSSSSPNDRSWRSYAWGLQINSGAQSGSINLAPITPGTSPNFMIAQFRCFRSVNPRDDIFGPFIKSILENTWLTARAGRLEYSAWYRRIFWMDIAAGFVRLNWKQSSRGYNPNHLDPNWASSWPNRYLRLEVPPAYQIGSSYRESPADTIFPPSTLDPPLWSTGPKGAFSFASTWRFSNINIWLVQL